MPEGIALSAPLFDDGPYLLEVVERIRKRPLRFWNRVIQMGTHWFWTGAKLENGYGVMAVGPQGAVRQVFVHRVAFTLFTGRVPTQYVDHVCRLLPCILHLEDVSNSTNVLRSRSPEVSRTRIRPTHCPSGHSYSGDNVALYVDPQGHTHMRCRACGRERWRHNHGRR
jgi:hypothetical protein